MPARLVLVLHSHLPYVKRQGRWPCGEVWLFEALSETYIPMLRNARRLKEEGVLPRVTISLSPTLLDQSSCHYIREEFISYLKMQERFAIEDEKEFLSRGDRPMARVAADYRRFYQDIRRDFVVEFNGDPNAAIRELAAGDEVELLATAGTHGYLPLLKDHDSLERQVSWGIETFKKCLGFAPRGFWLPECGYRKGLEDILISRGIRYFFVDAHGIEGGKPGQVFSAMQEFEDEGVEFFKETGLSTYRPYRVKDKPIAVFGRNTMVSSQVWSAEYGYPGDGWYREFHKTHPRSGLKYWRVTDRSGGLGSKLVYDPERALARTKEHARHFLATLADISLEANKMGFKNPLIVACYDTELFGHWWWEGVEWLNEVFKLLPSVPDLEVVSPAQVLREWDRLPEAEVFESSWGMGGKHFGWYNAETAWMWDTIHKAQEEYRDISGHQGAGPVSRAKAQAERELMLMESSDWFFMATNNHTRDYALKRFFYHYAKLMRLADMIRRGQFDEAALKWLQEVETEDDLFH